ncbi:acyltransferase, partial [Vibrio parahaemolyticus]
MTANTDPYIEIRPYNDEEIPAALDRLIQDDEFITAILDHRFENKAKWFKMLMSPFLRIYLKAKWSKLDSVEAIQIEVKKYLQDTLNKT